MKRILFLTTMVLLVASMSVMAEITLSGQVQYEWYQDFKSVYGYNADAELQFDAMVDDFNTAVIKLEYQQGVYDTGFLFQVDPKAAVQGQNPPAGWMEINKAYIDTKIGKLFGWEESGIQLNVIWGYQEFKGQEYAKITVFEDEEVWDFAAENWGIDFVLGIMNVVYLEAAIMPSPDVKEAIAGLYTTTHPVYFEAYYTAKEASTFENGNIGFAIQYDGSDISDAFGFKVAFGMSYALDPDIKARDDLAGTNKWLMGAGIATDIAQMFYVDVGWRGVDDIVSGVIYPGIGVNYQDFLGLDAGVSLAVDSEWFDSLLDEFDVSGWIKIGATVFRVGYAYHGYNKSSKFNHTGGGNPYGNISKGLKCPSDCDFDPTVANNGVAYFSGTLDF